MTATDGVAISGSRPEPVIATYRRLQRMGFEDAQAANLAALQNGFGIPSQPWTVRELTHLLFLRELRTGRRASATSDRASLIKGFQHAYFRPADAREADRQPSLGVATPQCALLPHEREGGE